MPEAKFRLGKCLKLLENHKMSQGVVSPLVIKFPFSPSGDQQRPVYRSRTNSTLVGAVSVSCQDKGYTIKHSPLPDEASKGQSWRELQTI